MYCIYIHLYIIQKNKNIKLVEFIMFKKIIFFKQLFDCFFLIKYVYVYNMYCIYCMYIDLLLFYYSSNTFLLTFYYYCSHIDIFSSKLNFL